MRRLHVTSTTGICTFVVLVVLKLQALLFYETTHAFSPSLPTSVLYSPLCTRKNPNPSRLAVVTEGTNAGDQNNTTESFPIRYDPSRIRFRCRIAYDGTSFAGFQLQGGRTGSNAKKTDTKTINNNNTSNSSKPLVDPATMTKRQLKQKRKNEKNNNPRTIQGEIEKVLSKRFQRLVKVLGAGRTDGGVHARGQAIHFDLYHNETNADSSSFERDLEITMNRMFPSDICAWNLGRVSPTLLTDSIHTPPGWYNWNAMRSSSSKLYSYRICVGDVMDPSDRHHRWQLPWQEFNLSRLETILHNFQGEHNFVCFAGALEQQEKKTGYAMSTVRTIHKINVVKETNTNYNEFHTDDHKDGMCGDPSHYYYRIDVYLDGALYKMVRNIVGMAIDVSRGWLDEEIFLDMLNRPTELNYTRKSNPCKPAPSNGLTLERVFYPDEIEF